VESYCRVNGIPCLFRKIAEGCFIEIPGCRGGPAGRGLARTTSARKRQPLPSVFTDYVPIIVTRQGVANSVAKAKFRRRWKLTATTACKPVVAVSLEQVISPSADFSNGRTAAPTNCWVKMPETARTVKWPFARKEVVKKWGQAPRQTPIRRGFRG
jgi:hypothetical protein